MATASTSGIRWPPVPSPLLLERFRTDPMFGLLDSLPLLIAQAAPAAAKDPGLIQYLPLLPIPFIFYFLLLRPQQQQDKKRREMVGPSRRTTGS